MASQLSQRTRGSAPRQFPRPEANEQFPLRWPGQIEIGGRSPAGIAGYGICEEDNDLIGMRQAGEPWRYSNANLAWTVTANTSIALNVASPNSAIGAAFTYGQNQPLIAGSGSFGTIVDTDADREGAPVREGEKFYIRAMGVEVLEPYVLVPGVNGLYTRSYPAWLSSSAVDYASRIKTVLLNGIALRFSFGDQACKFDLGLPSQWPQHGNVTGGTGRGIRNGVGFGPAQLMPLRRMFEAGAKDQTDKLTVEIMGGPSLSVGNDAANNIPALPEGQSLITPVQIILYGFPASPACAACDAEAISEAAMQMLARIDQDPAMRDTLRALLDRPR